MHHAAVMMQPSPVFRSGMDVLLDERRSLVAGRRVALLTHSAALNAGGAWSGELLWNDADVDLVCLMGPEHGVFGQAGPGEAVPTVTHPAWGIPVHSLYGDRRGPTAEMLDGVDVIVMDLQDLGVRCYTYASTLAAVMEAAAAAGKTLVIADRPVPLPGTADGPGLDPGFRGFVARVPTPLVYGMTPGELARLLLAGLPVDLELHVVAMSGYTATPHRGPDWPPWVPPSPGIRSWESAWCYPATVFCEALPGLDCGRAGPLPFQILGAPGLDGRRLAASFAEDPLPGVAIHPYDYLLDGQLVEGVRIAVTDPACYRPVVTGLTLLERIERAHGPAQLWAHPDARPAFFDRLCGTDRVRLGLVRGVPAAELAADWDADRAAFLAARAPCLLYAT